MDDLQIPETKYTLAINFNAREGVLEMTGSSYPASAVDFFDPIFTWVREYIATAGGPIQLDLKLNYLNTSSTKCILDILEILESYFKRGGAVRVNWYYAEDDEDIMETGEEIAEDIELPLNLIAYHE